MPRAKHGLLIGNGMALIMKVRKPLPKNQVECPKCGRRVLATNLAKHTDNPTCRVTQSQRDLRERGLVHLCNDRGQWLPALQRAGIPLERAPHRTELIDQRKAGIEARSGEKGWADEVIHGWYGPRWVRHVISAFSLKSSDRELLLAAVAKNVDLQAALCAVDRIDSTAIEDMLAAELAKITKSHRHANLLNWRRNHEARRAAKAG